uniref:Uncharacterized protein n=1 Tax=Neolamprologus brichardi TaxID=32507 RepID=A0A3Q4G4J4_NEOBR
MVYVSNGQVLDSRAQSPWRLSLLVDLFWGAVEFIVVPESKVATQNPDEDMDTPEPKTQEDE